MAASRLHSFSIHIPLIDADDVCPPTPPSLSFAHIPTAVLRRSDFLKEPQSVIVFGAAGATESAVIQIGAFGQTSSERERIHRYPD